MSMNDRTKQLLRQVQNSILDAEMALLDARDLDWRRAWEYEEFRSIAIELEAARRRARALAESLASE